MHNTCIDENILLCLKKCWDPPHIHQRGGDCAGFQKIRRMCLADADSGSNFKIELLDSLAAMPRLLQVLTL